MSVVRIATISLAVVGIAGAGLAAGLLLQRPGAEAPPVAVIARPAAQAVPAATRVVPDSQGQMQMSFAPVVKAVTPSVVNVYATTVTQSRPSPFASDPFFQRFFGGDMFGQGGPRESRSLGSGVIVDASGVILTNSHVVHGATDVRVATSDGREYAVDIVLDDAKTDLAALRIKDAGGRSFPALGFADSDGLEVGDLVLAIGNPFGVGQTVTSGIVSALARTGVESNNYEFFIQTDAAINPGNSGGALVDLQGRLVGINTAIFSSSGGSVGIGFAIPANMGRVVADAAIAGGTIVRPWFGARMQDVTADIADGLGLDRPRGALITEVAPGGPAERAGFKSGDVILSADGVAVDQPSAFDFRLATKPVGQVSQITIWRDRKEQVLPLTLEAPPSGSGATAAVSGNTRFAGAVVETVGPAVAQELGLDFNAKGVVIRSVADGSPAQQMGLQAGDVILNVNGQDMTDAESFKSLVSRRANAWQIVLQRGSQVFRSYVSG